MVRICERCLNPELLNTIELEVYGKRFPNFYLNDEVPDTVSDAIKNVLLNSPVLYIEFEDEISASKGVTVIFNDGHTTTYTPQVGSKVIQFGYTSGNNHTYQDSLSDWRIITIKFNGNIDNVVRYDSRYIRGRNIIPQLWKMVNLNNVTVTEAKGFIEFWAEGKPYDGFSTIPSELLKLINLKTFFVDNSLLAGSIVTRSIPIGLFNTSLEVLSYGGNSLSDVATNNFNKLPLLSTTLRELKISSSGLTLQSFPSNWDSNVSLRTVWFHGFNGTNSNIGKLLIPSLSLFYIISNNLGDPNDSNNWLDIPLNSELVTLQIYGSLNDTSKLPSNLQNATKLKYIFFGHSSIPLLKTTEQVTAWWSSWYPFIVANASMDEYAPDQKFRGITFDFRGGVVDTPIEAPNGYIQGSSNGTPTTLGQQIFVLSNQYDHVNSYTTQL